MSKECRRLHGLKSFKREFAGMLQQRDWMGCCGTESKTTKARHGSRQVVLTRYEVSYLTLNYFCIMKIFAILRIVYLFL